MSPRNLALPRVGLLVAVLLAGWWAPPAGAEDLLGAEGTWMLPCETAVLDVGAPGWDWALVEGFYPSETAPGEASFAWAGRSAAVALVVTTEGPRMLSLVLQPAVPGETLQISWDGRNLGEKQLEAGWQAVEWRLPNDLAAPGVHRMELSVGATRRFPPDPRELGFRVDRIELDPSPCPDQREPIVTAAGDAVTLEPGAVLVSRLLPPPRPEIRLEALGPPGARFAASWSVGGRREAVREVTLPSAGATALSIAVEACCQPDLVLAVWSSGDAPVRLVALELVGENGAGAWRVGCGLFRWEILYFLGGLALVVTLTWAFPAQGGRRSTWVGLVVVAGLALLVRAVFVGSYPDPAYSGDAWEYLERARLLASGDASFWSDTRWHAWQTWIRPPGYYLFLAATRLLPGSWQTWLVWSQVAFSVVTAVAIYWVALPLFGPLRGRRAGVAAGALFALYPEVVVTVSRVLTEPLYLVLLVPALAALARIGARPSTAWAAVAGALFGLAAYVRSAPVFFVPLAAVVLLLIHGWRRSLRQSVVLLLATAATVAPWMVRNSLLYGHPMGMDDLAVVNLLQTSPDENVVSTEGADLATREGWRSYYERLQAANRDRSLSREGGEILRRGLLRMVLQPEVTLKRFGRNVADFFSLYSEDFFGRSLREPRRCRSLLLADLANGGYLLVLALALGGLVPALRNRAAWPVLSWFVFNTLMINMIFHPEAKYRIPTWPVVIVMAGLAVALLVERFPRVPWPGDEQPGRRPDRPAR